MTERRMPIIPQGELPFTLCPQRRGGWFHWIFPQTVYVGRGLVEQDEPGSANITAIGPITKELHWFGRRVWTLRPKARRKVPTLHVLHGKDFVNQPSTVDGLSSGTIEVSGEWDMKSGD